MESKTVETEAKASESNVDKAMPIEKQPPNEPAKTPKPEVTKVPTPVPTEVEVDVTPSSPDCPVR